MRSKATLPHEASEEASDARGHSLGGRRYSSTFVGLLKVPKKRAVIHELQNHDQLSQRFSTTTHDSCSARHSIIHFFFNRIAIIQIQIHCSLALNVHMPPIFCWISNFSTAARHTHARQTYPYIRVQVQPSTSMTCRLRLACANI